MSALFNIHQSKSGSTPSDRNWAINLSELMRLLPFGKPLRVYVFPPLCETLRERNDKFIIRLKDKNWDVTYFRFLKQSSHLLFNLIVNLQ
ncbi:MAG: hypothetical protein KAF91_24565 [Nostoc sp. TH1S01]|nr:hypothetical protein [Nostoc sp. TH1S01]